MSIKMQNDVDNSHDQKNESIASDSSSTINKTTTSASTTKQITEYRTVTSGVSAFWAAKHAREAPKNWDSFYKRNGTNFFRDRHWTTTESTDGFAQLSQIQEKPITIVEAGCGVANTIWPLFEINPTITVHAFDFSPTAVNLIQSNELYKQYNGIEKRLNVFVWDFCSSSDNDTDKINNIPPLNENEIDYITLIFVLSAIPPEKHKTGLSNLCKYLKKGGKILFRDYGDGDLAQKRFKNRNRISDCLFVRQDRTLSYFFDENYVVDLINQMDCLKVSYIRQVKRVIENKKEQKVMHRIFVQAEFEKI